MNFLTRNPRIFAGLGLASALILLCSVVTTAILAIVFYALSLLVFFAMNREPRHPLRPPPRIQAPADGSGS